MSQVAGPSSKKKNKTLSQSTLQQSFITREQEEELINKCVRYIIYRAGSNLPIRRPELLKNVSENSGKPLNDILNKATKILKDVYGYDLYLNEDCPDGSKQYLVGNLISYKPVPSNEENDEIPDDVNKILIMLVLTHIFMSNDSVSEGSLFAFLTSIKLDPTKKHKLFGNIKEFVTSKMVKQKYLNVIIDSTVQSGTYSWGARARHEVSQHKLLEFVCKVYKNRAPQSWITQFENANKQSIAAPEESDAEEEQEQSIQVEDSD